MSLNTQVLDRQFVEELPYVEANLHYLVPMAERPVNYTYEPPAGIPRQNGVYEPQSLPIRNARSILGISMMKMSCVMSTIVKRSNY